MEPLGPVDQAFPAPAPAGAGASLSPEGFVEAETLEWIERRAFQSLLGLAPREARLALGIRTAVRGLLFGGFAPALDHPAFNRVLGLGLDPSDPEALEAALGMARAAGARRAHLAVMPGPHALLEALAARGLRPDGCRVRLSRSLEQPFHAGYPGRRDGRPRARALERPEAAAFATLAAEASGLPAAAGLLAGAARSPGWVPFGAWWGEEPVGAAWLYCEGPAAWLGFGCVREPFRGRGIQAALIGERLLRAREAGCVLATAETGDWTGGRPPSAMRNLLRFGFEPRYHRPNYLMTGG